MATRLAYGPHAVTQVDLISIHGGRSIWGMCILLFKYESRTYLYSVSITLYQLTAPHVSRVVHANIEGLITFRRHRYLYVEGVSVQLNCAIDVFHGVFIFYI